MAVLVDILLIVIAFGFIFEISKRYKKMSFFSSLFLMSSIIGTVYDTVGSGGDYDNYRYSFQHLVAGKIPEKEKLFYFVNVVFKNFTDNYAIVYYSYILFINLLIVYIIYKYSKNIELSLLIYIVMAGYSTASNITRQFCAVAIFTYSIKYLIRNEYYKYIIAGMIAFQFHSTAVVAFTIGLLVKVFTKKISENYIMYFIGINSLIVIEPIIRQIAIELLYEGYNNSTFEYGSNILHYVVQLFFVAIYIFSLSKKEIDEDTKLIINIATIASAFTLLSQNMVLYARIATYFNIFNAIAIPNVIIENNYIKERRILFYSIFLVIIIYYAMLTRGGFILESFIMDYFYNIFK